MPRHIPVLLKESIEGLDIQARQVFVDGTYGGGGHTREMKRRFPKVKTISIDQDPSTDADLIGNFRHLDILLGDTHPDAILLDLGLSSDQLEASGRGFSFQKDEPLDMRMSQTGISAADILNSFDEHAIELILRGFGEERYSKQIAREITRRREAQAFVTTYDLVEAVTKVKPKSWRDKIHPATKTFQAIRIAVNEELTALEEGLDKAFSILNPEGRLAVISFHSLEDRIVKKFFRNLVQTKKGEYIHNPLRSSGRGKPIEATDEEIKVNPRSRAAKLRIIKKY